MSLAKKIYFKPDLEEIGIRIGDLVVGNTYGVRSNDVDLTGTFGGVRDGKLQLRSGTAYGPGSETQQFDRKEFPLHAAKRFIPY